MTATTEYVPYARVRTKKRLEEIRRNISSVALAIRTMGDCFSENFCLVSKFPSQPLFPLQLSENHQHCYWKMLPRGRSGQAVLTRRWPMSRTQWPAVSFALLTECRGAQGCLSCHLPTGHKSIKWISFYLFVSLQERQRGKAWG